MSLTKDELKNEILDLIRKVGKEKNGYLKFDFDCLLRKWEPLHPGEPFSNHGFGGFKKFLEKVCNAEDLGERYFGIPKGCSSPQSDKKAPHVAQKFETASSKENEIPEPTGARPKLIILKAEFLCLIHEILEEDRYIGKEEAAIKLNTLLEAWQKIHPKEKFPAPAFGKFKQFLIHHCNLKPPANSNEREVVIANKESVENQIKELLTNYKDVIPAVGGLLKGTAPDPTAVRQNPLESQNMNDDAVSVGNTGTTEDHSVQLTQAGEEIHDSLQAKPPIPPNLATEQVKEPDVELKQLILKSKGPTNDQ